MTKELQPPANSYSGYSGAYRIYQTTMNPNAKPEIFYHRGRDADYLTCGTGLPTDTANVEELWETAPDHLNDIV
jgi:hypothetical protein